MPTVLSAVAAVTAAVFVVALVVLPTGVSAQEGTKAAAVETCEGCKYVWSKANSLLDESAGYENVKDAFERVCANMPRVFYDACDVMFENEDRMIQDYLDGATFQAMCTRATLCLAMPTMPAGGRGAKGGAKAGAGKKRL
jgi:hypothetical protein